ncbi:MAG TPA: hypothetical protein VK943_05975, partial [Arenibaculum sp.]|nr:hypothetical protein [Arenibaculum sp.]
MGGSRASFAPAPLFDGEPGPDRPAAGVRRVRVLLPLPLPEAYDYRVGSGEPAGEPAGQSAGEPIGPGDYVEVPLGPRRVVGVVWGEGKGEGRGEGRGESGAVADARLRPVIRRFGVPPMPETHRRFVDWVAGYTMSAPGAVLKMVLGATAAGLEPPRPVTAYRLADAGRLAGLKLTPARRRVLDLLGGGPPRPAAELALEAGCGGSV